MLGSSYKNYALNAAKKAVRCSEIPKLYFTYPVMIITFGIMPQYQMPTKPFSDRARHVIARYPGRCRICGEAIMIE